MGRKEIVIILALIEVTLSQKCDLTKCSNAYTLENKKQMDPIVSINVVSAFKKTWEEEEQIVYSKRRRFTSYCYQGSVLDPNTGCDNELKTINMKKEEALTNAEREECPTGYECGRFDCIGSPAQKCLTERLVNPVGPKQMGLLGGNLDAFAQHTCVSKWECNIRKVVVPVRLMISGMEIIRFFTTKDGQIIQLDNNHYEKGTLTWDNFIIYSVKEKPKEPESKKVKMRCYSSSPENIKCSERGKGGNNVDISSERLQGIHSTSLYTIIDPIKTIINSKEAEIHPNVEEDKDISSITFMKTNVQKAPSIESVQNLIVGLKMTQMQELYNTYENRVTITEIEGRLKRMLSFLSKIHPKLLSYVMGKNFRTKWLNSNVFQVCPCTDPPPTVRYSNCYGGYKYIDGEFIKINGTPSDNCTHVDETKIEKIALSSNNSLDVEILDYDPVNEASTDSSIWDWLVKERNKEFDQKEKRPEKDIAMIIESLGIFPDWKNILLYFTAAITFFNMMILLIVVRR